MKKLLFLLTATLCVAFVKAQKLQQKEVPLKVKAALKQKFPDASHIKWEKEDQNFEAGFKSGTTHSSVLFNATGDILETETAIAASDLSNSIKQYIQKNYPGKKIKEAASITDAKGVVTYEAEVSNLDLIFNSNGEFIKEIKK